MSVEDHQENILNDLSCISANLDDSHVEENIEDDDVAKQREKINIRKSIT